MAGRNRGYYTSFRYPRRKTEKRLPVPQPIKRPVRFQLRSIIRKDLIDKDTWWFIIHRRGPHQPKVGEDPLEARAVPESLVRGTLPERILYKALVDFLHFIPGMDFDQQTSLQGGRMELGGIVADFIFYNLMIVIQVQGPTHLEYFRTIKDAEQAGALNELGYTVYYIWEDDIYDETRLENWLRRVFNWADSAGAGQQVSGQIAGIASGDEMDERQALLSSLNKLQSEIEMRI